MYNHYIKHVIIWSEALYSTMFHKCLLQITDTFTSLALSNIALVLKHIKTEQKRILGCKLHAGLQDYLK